MQLSFVIDESHNARGFTPGSMPGVRRTIEEIIIHHWGAFGQTHDGVVNFFENGPGATSAHFVVSGKRVTCLVSPADIAWHAGNWTVNCRSIGIECRPEATDEDYATVAELVRWLREQYGNLPLRRHRDYFPTACPGQWDIGRIDALARAVDQVMDPVVTQATPNAPRTYSDNELHWIVERGDTLSKIAQHYYGDVKYADTIAKYNNVDPTKLRIGQKIWVPGPIRWTIEGPDTVQSICDYYGISWEWLARYNPAQVWGPDTELYIGNVLVIIP